MNSDLVCSGHIDQLRKEEEDGLVKPDGITSTNRFLFPVPVTTVHAFDLSSCSRKFGKFEAQG